MKTRQLNRTWTMLILTIRIANVNGVVEQVATAPCRHRRRLPSARSSHRARRRALGQAQPNARRLADTQASRQRIKAEATGRLVLTRNTSTSIGTSKHNTRCHFKSTTSGYSNYVQLGNESTMALRLFCFCSIGNWKRFSWNWHAINE